MTNPERVSVMATCSFGEEKCEQIAARTGESLIYQWTFYREALNNAWVKYIQDDEYIIGECVVFVFYIKICITKSVNVYAS